MKYLLFPVLVLPTAVLLNACSGGGSGSGSASGSSTAAAPGNASATDPGEPTRAQPRLPTLKLYIGAEEMTAEMALTWDQQRTGMMFRTNMAETEGMIFAAPVAHRAGFWMKNCPLPLSAAYIDDEGVIQEIHDLQPFNTNTVLAATSTIRYVLETRQGWFARHRIGVGTLIRSERGSLHDTFFKRE